MLASAKRVHMAAGSQCHGVPAPGTKVDHVARHERGYPPRGGLIHGRAVAELAIRALRRMTSGERGAAGMAKRRAANKQNARETRPPPGGHTCWQNKQSCVRAHALVDNGRAKVTHSLVHKLTFPQDHTSLRAPGAATSGSAMAMKSECRAPQATRVTRRRVRHWTLRAGTEDGERRAVELAKRLLAPLRCHGGAWSSAKSSRDTLSPRVQCAVSKTRHGVSITAVSAHDASGGFRVTTLS